ncbi:hypothetical protein MTP99_001909 [Tenebrio molitor]|nr:hypothetical protein MTP99_001909 [Tenebrio molitor]
MRNSSKLGTPHSPLTSTAERVSSPNRTHVSGGNKLPPDPRYAAPMPEDRHCSSAFLISLFIFLSSIGVKRSAKDNLRHLAALRETLSKKSHNSSHS